MFTLTDGRDYLYQWDIDRTITVDDPTVTEVHFCNKTADCSLVVEVKDGIANIPNQILQYPYDIRVFAYCNCYTKVEKTLKVKARSKPDDYAYTETEIRSYEYLEAKLTQIEEQGWSDEVVTKSINEYLYANPMTMYDDGNGNITFEVIPDGQEVKY